MRQVLSILAAVLLSCTSAHAQTQTYTGSVVADANGEAFFGAGLGYGPGTYISHWSQDSGVLADIDVYIFLRLSEYYQGYFQGADNILTISSFGPAGASGAYVLAIGSGSTVVDGTGWASEVLNLSALFTFGAHDYSRLTPGQIVNYSVTVVKGPVPEPAAWAMLIGGFGLAGATLRRRRHPSHEQSLSCARPMRFCARRLRILPRRSSTARSGDDRVH